jgi:hypothetical protein
MPRVNAWSHEWCAKYASWSENEDAKTLAITAEKMPKRTTSPPAPFQTMIIESLSGSLPDCATWMSLGMVAAKDQKVSRLIEHLSL